MRSFCSGMMRAKTVAVRRRCARAASSSAASSLAADNVRRHRGRPARRDRRGRRGIVAGDHHDPHAGRAALADRVRHVGAQRVGEADQAEEFEGEIRCGARAVAARRLSGARHAQDTNALPPPSRPPPRAARRAAPGRDGTARRSPPGAPLAQRRRLAIVAGRQTLVMARRSGRSPYCRTSSGRHRWLSEPASLARQPSIARSIGSNGSRALARMPSRQRR